MKSIFVTIAMVIGFSTTASADSIPVGQDLDTPQGPPVTIPKPPSKQPEVECRYTVSTLAKSGATLEMKHGQPLYVSNVSQKTTSVMGVVLKASLRQVCAMNVPGMGAGAPCFDSYTLNVSVERGADSANLGLNISSADKGKRFSVNLHKTGKQNAFASCDVK
jgi:hypothetical protein